MKNAAFPTLLLMIACLGSVFAQPCYETMRTKGVQLMNKSEHGAAISQFWVALNTCSDIPANNDLQKLITQAQNAQISALQVVIQEKNVLYEAAVQARDEASEAREKEKIAKDEAVRSAIFAREQGRRAESLRLALLSDILRAKGLPSEALKLAFVALKISPADSATVMQRAFGDAVRDSFRRAVYSGLQAAEDAHYLPSSNSLLIRTGEQSLLFGSASGNKSELLPAGGRNLGLAISPSGAYFLSWADNRPVQLWNDQGVLLATLSGHTEPLRYAAFSSEESNIITCSRDNTARLWDLKGNQLAVLSDHTGNVYSGDFLPGGKQVFTRSSDGTVRVWDRSGTPLASLNEAGIYTYAAQANTAGNSLLTASADGFVRLWSSTGQLQVEKNMQQGPVKEAVFAPENDRFYVRTRSPVISAWDLKGQPKSELRHAAAVEGMTVEPGKGRIASWTSDFAIQLWEPDGQQGHRFVGHSGAILSVAFLPGRDLILSASKDGTAKLWDTKGNILMDWNIDPNCVKPALLSPDQEHILIVEPDKSLSITPLPELILHQMQATVDLKSPEMREWMKKYEVQLFED